MLRRMVSFQVARQTFNCSFCKISFCFFLCPFHCKPSNYNAPLADSLNSSGACENIFYGAVKPEKTELLICFSTSLIGWIKDVFTENEIRLFLLLIGHFTSWAKIDESSLERESKVCCRCRCSCCYLPQFWEYFRLLFAVAVIPDVVAPVAVVDVVTVIHCHCVQCSCRHWGCCCKSWCS